MAVDAVEATESFPKEAGLVGLDGPLDELDLTKMLVENFENNGPEETLPSGDAVEEAEPVEGSTRKQGTPNTFFHRRNRKRNPRRKPKGNRMNRNGFSVGLIASPENYGWRRRSATNLKKKSPS